MPRARNPNRDKAYELWVASNFNIKLKDIAAQLGETESTIRKWKCTDKWEQKAKGALQKEKESAPKENGTSNEEQTKKKSGAPLGNKNAFKHGGYSAAYFDTLDEDEKAMIENMPESEEELLLDQIKLYTVNERRLLLAIQKVKKDTTFIDENGNVKSTDKIFDTMNMRVTQRTYSTEKEQIQNFEHKDNRLMRLYAELTKVQRAKTKCLESLFRIHHEQEKMELLRGNNGKDDTRQLIDDWIAAVMGAKKNE